MNKSTTKRFFPIIFFGVAWGLLEAVFGYLLHLVPFDIAGFIMYPIGFYCMLLAYKKSNKHISFILSGLIAAAIKLSNILIIGNVTILVIKPAIFIILEAVVSLVIVSALELLYGKSKTGVKINI